MDARSLLRAKKAESRIEHPHATYTTAGQLRCSICAIPVKQWDAHLLTKQHRASLAREKLSGSVSAKSKRPADNGSGGGESTKRPRVETEEVVRSSILPAGFFSSGSGPRIVTGEEDEEDEEATSTPAAGPSTTKPAPSAPVSKAKSNPSAVSVAPAPGQTGDEELDSFLASLAEPDPVEPETAAAEPAPTAASQKATSRKPATTSSYRDFIPGQASYEAAPVRNVPKDQEPEVAQPEVQESEAERRARLAREEQEEIMNRLEEEERAQEDGDSRVAALKQRMEMLKKRREAKAKAGGKAKAV